MAKQNKSKNQEYGNWLQEVRDNPPRPYPWKPYKDSLISPSHDHKSQPHGDKLVGYACLGGALIILIVLAFGIFKAIAEQQIGAVFALILVGVGACYLFIRVGLEHLRYAPSKQKRQKKKKK